MTIFSLCFLCLLVTGYYVMKYCLFLVCCVLEYRVRLLVFSTYVRPDEDPLWSKPVGNQ